MAGGPAAGGIATNPNINQMAAQGIKGAGIGSALGMGYTPGSVTVGSTTPNVNVSGVAPTVSAGQLASTSMTPYMNPYTTDVIKANETDILRGGAIGLNELNAQAGAAGAFGGSRHGIATGEMGRGIVEQLAQSSAGLRQSGYQNAQQAALSDIQNKMQSDLANQQSGQFDISAQMQSDLANQSGSQFDITNRMQAALANQSAGLQGQQQRLGAAGQLADISNLGFGMGQTVTNNLATQGAQQQALQQALMDTARQNYAGYTNQPAQSIGYASQALGAAPVPQTQTNTRQPGLFDYLTLGATAASGGAFR